MDEPKQPAVRVKLVLQYFDTEMPLHKIVDLDATRAKNAIVSRHIVKVYDSHNIEVGSAIVSDDLSAATEQREIYMDLVPGQYSAVCWTDFTEGSTIDRHYDTSAFPQIELRYSESGDGSLFHEANTPWRDGFSGRRHFQVNDSSVSQEIQIEMRRPLARFIFEATDFEDFMAQYNVAHVSGDESSQLLAGYTVLFRYRDYMPACFSALSNAPVDSRVGAAFWGQPQYASGGSGTIELGSDFVFVHPLETSVDIVVEVIDDSTGEPVSRSGPFAVPLLRNKLTIVRGRFLTSKAGAGIVVDVSFAGDYNIKI